jgi:heme/copper-type cytochrome/quinol oxidase subunit 4
MANTTESNKTAGMGKDLIVYVCLLVLAGVQFMMAYQNLTVNQMFTRMLFVATIEASLAMLFFMHLYSEKRAFLIFVVVFTVSVLLGMQYGWTDSNRMVDGAPYSEVK